MTDYMTEQEQIELLKSWLKEYGLMILLGLAVAAIGIFGWRLWDQRQQSIQLHASILYDDMLRLSSQRNDSAALQKAKRLDEHYSQTVYGNMADFLLAKNALEKKQYTEAETYLTKAMNQFRDKGLKQIARIRLARVYIAAKTPEKAITLLSTIDAPAFTGLIEEVKGDAYLASNQPKLARAAYENALKSLPNADEIRPLLQLKYDAIATSA